MVGQGLLESQSQNCLLSAGLILTILESEVSAVGSSYKHIDVGLISQDTLESELSVVVLNGRINHAISESQLSVVGLPYIINTGVGIVFCRLVL